MAAMAGGLAVGVLSSRVLPPMLAAATGSMRARFGEGPFERLKEDHRHILTILERMLAAPDGSRAGQAPLFLSLKRTLAKHALAEEDVVYPMLSVTAGATEAAKRLYSEHADVKIHLYQLETALRDGTSWASPLRSLRDLLVPHIRSEEEVEFPKLERLMDERISRTATGKIRREEAMIL
jgi:iron-sulfur cluster repair protein YtfE (RIC family)